MISRYFYFLFATFIFSICSPGLSEHSRSYAQISFSGYLSNYNAYTTTPNYFLLAGRNTLRLNVLNQMDSGRIYISGNLRQNYAAASDSLDFRLREAYLDLFFDQSDLRIGKQPIVWGKTEGDFIFDILSPFDLSEFITQDFRELREGVTAINFTYFSGPNELQLIFNPVFEPSRLPDYEGVWGIVPADIFPLPRQFQTYNPGRATIRDGQFAARFAWRPHPMFDLDLAAMYWKPSTPGYRKSIRGLNLFLFEVPEEIILEEVYKTTSITGFWGEYRPYSNFSFVFEAAYFNERPYDILPENFSSDDLRFLTNLDILQATPEELARALQLLGSLDSFIREANESGLLTYKPSIKWMAGFRTSIMGWNTSMQYIADAILDYDEDILQDSWFHGLSFTAFNSFARDRLMLRLTGRHNFTGADYWINPELGFDLRDGLTLSAGGHFFAGPRVASDYANLSFSRYRENSLIYLSAAWFW
ncbi:MAG: hypothetical protein LAT67_06975 [Balneolales bacterium]|nr:hypothetical protein [Balneolales bacterium]